MIQTKANSLHQLIHEKRILRSEKNHIQAYKTRRDQLQREVEKVVQLCQMVDLMREYDICTGDYTEEMQSLRSMGIHLKEQFIEAPEWLKEQGTLRTLTMKVDSVKQQIEQEMKTKWEEYVEEDLPSIHNDMLAIMANIPSFSARINQIRNLNNEISEQKESIPVSETELKAVVKKKEELIDKWNTLGADDIPSAVLTFIRSAAARQGALLNNLTPEVLAWLKRYNIQSFFKIHLQSEK